MKWCIAIICNNEKNIPWMSVSMDFLKRAFEYSGITAEFVSNLTYNVRDVHPSWYKLLIHKHLEYKYDYCLCWDVDLLPTHKHSVLDIQAEIESNKFYACRDTGTLYSDSYFVEIPQISSHFRWNCGLFGIPKSQSAAMEYLYQTNHNSTKPSYEQYHIAEYLYHHKDYVIDGNPCNNVLVQAVSTSNLNHVLHFGTSNCLHYSISDPNIRGAMILEHCSWKDRIYR